MQMFKSFDTLVHMQIHLNKLIPTSFEHIDANHLNTLNANLNTLIHIDSLRCKCLNHLNTLIPSDANV